jgi:hypothetical protein
MWWVWIVKLETAIVTPKIVTNGDTINMVKTAASTKLIYALIINCIPFLSWCKPCVYTNE